MREDYQYNFSGMHAAAMYHQAARERKAKTMMAVLKDFFQTDMRSFTLLDIGSSTGIIDSYLSEYFGKVIGIDIDHPALAFARDNFPKKNLQFLQADSMDLCLQANVFDVVVCAQVYEHVPDAARMMKEIYRTLKPGGVCYFAASNRLRVTEPHYNLPFLSVIPRPLAHAYLYLSGKSKYYYEKHASYWGLKRLVKLFERIDYTRKIIDDPQRFFAQYLIKPGTVKARVAKFIINHAYWLCPGYIWLLRKAG